MSVELAPPVDLVLPDHVTSGGDAAALAAIDDPAITLAIWQRPSPLDAPDLTDWQSIRFAGPAQTVQPQLAMRLGIAGPD